MGAKEERLPVRYQFGYAGQMNPVQTVGGKCEKCGQDVWINYKPTSKEYRETRVVHHGCENREKHRS